MQHIRRTRIFTVAVLLAGLLLGLGVLVATIMPEAAMPASARSKHHHQQQQQKKQQQKKQQQQQTQTQTQTQTIDIGPPASTCTTSPNPAKVSASNPQQGTVTFTQQAPSTAFVVLCKNLTTNATYFLTTNLTCSFIQVLGPNNFSIGALGNNQWQVNTLNNGELQFTVVGNDCGTGTYLFVLEHPDNPTTFVNFSETLH